MDCAILDASAMGTEARPRINNHSAAAGPRRSVGGNSPWRGHGRVMSGTGRAQHWLRAHSAHSDWCSMPVTRRIAPPAVSQRFTPRARELGSYTATSVARAPFDLRLVPLQSAGRRTPDRCNAARQPTQRSCALSGPSKGSRSWLQSMLSTHRFLFALKTKSPDVGLRLMPSPGHGLSHNPTDSLSNSH